MLWTQTSFIWISLLFTTLSYIVLYQFDKYMCILRSSTSQKAILIHIINIFVYSSTFMFARSKQLPKDIKHMYFVQSMKQFSFVVFGITFNFFSDSFLICSIVENICSLMVLLRFENNSHEAKSGEHGGWGLMSCCFYPKTEN